jgi:1,4-dihydroxy-2-naphthoate octaprenyltransferase
MPTQYLTLRKNDPDFLNQLWGRGETDKRAIPVKTYNLGTEEESVTFEIKPISDIQKPSLLKVVAALVKLKSFILILFPLFFVLVKNSVDNRFFDPLSMTIVSVATILLFAGLNIRNDVYDHISGFDRVNLDSTPKPIRLGWISAHKASRISLILIFISAFITIPVMILQLELIRVIAVALILFFIGRFAKNNSYKDQHFGEFILFMLIGPALVSGYQVALGAGVDTEILGFGVLWGFAVMFLIQVNNFSHIMTSSQSGIKNSMTKLGFDLSQKFLIASWVAFIGLWIVFHYNYAGTYWSVFGTILLIFWSLPLFMKISNIKSPMGSGLQVVRREAYKTFIMMVFLFFMENLWVIWADLI